MTSTETPDYMVEIAVKSGIPTNDAKTTWVPMRGPHEDGLCRKNDGKAAIADFVIGALGKASADPSRLEIVEIVAAAPTRPYIVWTRSPEGVERSSVIMARHTAQATFLTLWREALQACGLKTVSNENAMKVEAAFKSGDWTVSSTTALDGEPEWTEPDEDSNAAIPTTTMDEIAALVMAARNDILRTISRDEANAVAKELVRAQDALTTVIAMIEKDQEDRRRVRIVVTRPADVAKGLIEVSAHADATSARRQVEALERANAEAETLRKRIEAEASRYARTWVQDNSLGPNVGRETTMDWGRRRKAAIFAHLAATFKCDVEERLKTPPQRVHEIIERTVQGKVR